MRGDERRRDWYCRCSCDLRNSGGLCDGGCVRGYRCTGGTAVIVCSMGGAGVVAEARDACRHCQQIYGVLDSVGLVASCLDGIRIRGGIVTVRTLALDPCQ